MRKYLSFLALWGVALVAGCSTTPVQEPSTPKAPESLAQNFDCKGKEYYTNLTWSGNFTLQRDEAESGFSAVIPELCVKLVSRPRDTNTSLSEWKAYNENPTYWPKEILKWTLSGNSIVLWVNWQARYIFNSKEKGTSLAQAIQTKYNLDSDCWVKRDPDLNGKKQDLYARPHILWESDEKSRYTLNTHEKDTCSPSYPTEDVGFWELLPYDILYTDKQDTRYLLYNLSVTQESSSPYLNMTFEYTD